MRRVYQKFWAVSRLFYGMNEYLQHLDIKSNITEQIKDFCTHNAIPLSNIGNRVAVVSAKNVLEGTDAAAIDSFVEAFNSVILSQYQKQLQTRRSKLLFDLAENLVFMLKEMLSNLKLDEGEFEAKEKALQKEKKELDYQIEKINNGLERMKDQLEKSLVLIAKNSISSLIAAAQIGNQSFSEAMNALIQEMNVESEKIVTSHIKENLNIPKLSFECYDITHRVTKYVNIIESGKTFMTAAMVAIITVLSAGAAGGAAAGAGAGGAAGAGGTAAGAGGAAGVAGKKIGQAAAVETAKKVAQSKTKAVLLTLGKFLKDINPFELGVVGFIQSKNLIYTT